MLNSYCLERQRIKLPGLHNLENVMAAAGACYLRGAGLDSMKRVFTSFEGVEHRLELVRVLDGVHFYNDSIATTPARAIAGLKALEMPVVLIAGGYDKKLPFDEFAGVVVERVRHLVLVGETAPLIERAVSAAERRMGRTVSRERAGTFEDAVRRAAGAARPGDAVLLSPACASYDMFRNFEERGERFREIVRGL